MIEQCNEDKNVLRVGTDTTGKGVGRFEMGVSSKKFILLTYFDLRDERR